MAEGELRRSQQTVERVEMEMTPWSWRGKDEGPHLDGMAAETDGDRAIE
jgi:hypothetical protein